MTDAPRLSVVIPTRDRLDLLGECLALLEPARQGLAPGDVEIVVGDDSVTGSAQPFLAAHHPAVRWVAGPRRGPAANRNAAAAAARGEWLVFTDDDCLPAAGWLRAYVEAFPSAHDVYEGRTTCEAGITSPRQTAPVNLTGGNLWSCNFAMRREAFARLGGFDERFPFPHKEDEDFRERVAAAGLATRFVPSATVDHPPRRLPWGARQARIHQATVLFMVLHPPEHGLAWFLQNEIRVRLSKVVRMPKSVDSLTALASLPVELWTIIVRWRSWWAWSRRVAAR